MYYAPSMSVFAFLPVVFYKNILIFLGVVILKKTYVSESTSKYASINVFKLRIAAGGLLG